MESIDQLTVKLKGDVWRWEEEIFRDYNLTSGENMVKCKHNRILQRLGTGLVGL